MSEVITYDKYSIRGVENGDVRYNIFIDNEDETGQFAMVYLDSPNYVYEFLFNVNDVPQYNANSEDGWENVRAYCFAHEESWTEIYLPVAVTVIQETETIAPQSATSSTSSDDEIEEFENWLIDKYGSEYIGKPVTPTTSKTQNGVTMYLKSGFIVRAEKDHTYVLNQTMSVVGFATAVLGFSAENPVVGVLGLIAGASGLFSLGQSLGQSVYQYKLSAIWCKYATCVEGTGYPYGIAHKFTYFDGYSYSETGTCNVDEASESTSYAPSSTVYNSSTNVYNAAFDEYGRIGFQDGNF